jgi:hypothetical protein
LLYVFIAVKNKFPTLGRISVQVFSGTVQDNYNSPFIQAYQESAHLVSIKETARMATMEITIAAVQFQKKSVLRILNIFRWVLVISVNTLYYFSYIKIK